MTTRSCRYEGCTRPYKAKGLCSLHYQRMQNGWAEEEMNLPPLRYRGDWQPDQCNVEGCQSPRFSRGVCQMHYYRLRTAGDAGPAGRVRRYMRSCKVSGCDNRAVTSDDLCPTHRRRKRLYGTEDGSFATHAKCCEPSCEQPAIQRRSELTEYRCHEHSLVELRRAAHAGELQPSVWQGYEQVTLVKHKYLVHRLVMEHALGRPLLPHESVHHINGDRADNRIENLELWSKSQPSGQRVVDKVAWAIELLELYAPDVLADRAQLRLVV